MSALSGIEALLAAAMSEQQQQQHQASHLSASSGSHSSGSADGLQTLLTALQSSSGRGPSPAPTTDHQQHPTLSSQVASTIAVPQSHPPPTGGINTQALQALLTMDHPSLLALLSALPQPPHSNPHAPLVTTRSGRPSRPPQYEDPISQLQAGGFDLSFLDSLAFGLNGSHLLPTQGEGLNAFASGSGAGALMAAGGGSGGNRGQASSTFNSNHPGGPGTASTTSSGEMLDWWWPVQEEGEEEDPSYFPPSTSTPTRLETPVAYSFTPSAFTDNAELFDASRTTPAAMTESTHQNTGNGNTASSSFEPNGAHTSPAHTPRARSRHGKERATPEPVIGRIEQEQPDGEDGEVNAHEEEGGDEADEPSSKRARGMRARKTSAEEDEAPSAETGKGKGRVKLSKEEMALRKKERNKAAANESRRRAKLYVMELEEENKKLRDEVLHLRTLLEQERKLRATEASVPKLSWYPNSYTYPPPAVGYNIYQPDPSLVTSSPPPHPFAELPPTPKKTAKPRGRPSKAALKQKRKEERRIAAERRRLARELAEEGVEEEESAVETEGAEQSDAETGADDEEQEEEQELEFAEFDDPSKDADYVAVPSIGRKRKRDGSDVPQSVGTSSSRGGGSGSGGEVVKGETEEAEGNERVVREASVASAIVAPSSEVDPEDYEDEDEDEEELEEDVDDEDFHLPIRDVPIPEWELAVPLAAGASPSADATITVEKAGEQMAPATPGKQALGNKEVVDLLKQLLSKIGG